MSQIIQITKSDNILLNIKLCYLLFNNLQIKHNIKL